MYPVFFFQRLIFFVPGLLSPYTIRLEVGLGNLHI